MCANEIRFYLSGGSSNANPFLSNGGSISNTEIVNSLLNNLWPDVSESDSDVGLTDHKVIFVKNVSGAALADIKAYFGELDNFMGMAVLSTTTTNASVASLAVATDAVTDYYLIWQNIAESASSSINLNQTYKRVCLYISGVNHQAYNQYPDKLDIQMAKTGAPTGTATVKIWAMASGMAPTANDNTVIRTLGTIDVASLATTMTTKTFNTVADLVTNPLPSVGWRIGIEYTGGTATAHVDIAQTAQVATAGAATTTNAWVMIVYIRTDSISGFDNAAGEGILLSHEISEALSDPAVGVDYQNGENFVEQTGWADPSDPDTGDAGGEISDICTISPPADDQSYSDGLHVNCYWDYKTQRCVAAGATSPLKLNSGQSTPNVTNHGGVTPPAPKIVLVFWGNTWNSSNSSVKTRITNMIQNQLLGTDKQFFNIAITSYQHGMPVWGGSLVWNQNLPADPTGNGYTDDEVYVAYQGVIHSGNSIIDPLQSMFLSQAVNVSNLVICMIPDRSWDLENGANAGYGAYHTSDVYTATVTDPTPPPPTPTPGPQPVSPKGGFTQAWDGSKWVDFASTSPAMNIYTNHGPCFQSGNPPPPGGGVPPPGNCGSTAAAQGTIPVAGGGGGTVNHGYAMTSATDNGNDGNQATGAIDRNLSTRWSQNSTNALLTVDMGAAHPIDRLKIAWYKGDERQAKFKISYSTDNTIYTNIPPLNAAPNFTAAGNKLTLEEFSLVQASPQNAITARFVRYTGLGNTLNTWNSVTELEVWGPDSGDPTTSPPPTPGGGGINFSKPSSYDTGLVLPNLNNGDFVAIHLERLIPPRSNHVELENYSIVISNEPHPAPPSDEPIPGLPGGGGGGPGTDPNLPPIGDIPLPTPPGVFDPGTIPPPEPIPAPTPGDPGGTPCPGDPNQPPPPPEPGQPPTGGGGVGTTPDGTKLVELPAGYVYADQHTNFNENFQSNGSYRLDCGVQPQLNELNLSFYLNLSSGSDEISSKLSGGKHSDSAPKNGRCYDIGLNQAGDRVRIRKENPHPDYHDGPPSHSISVGSLNGKWVGVQSLKWNEGANVHLQCWIDTSGASSPTNKWTRILDDIDTGNWYDPPYLTTYDSSDSQTTIRVDGMSSSKFHYQNLCATRIKKS